jgi:3-dehydroquinate synthase II
MKEIIVDTDDEELRKEARFLGLGLRDELDDIVEAKVSTKEDEERLIKTAEASPALLITFADQEIIPLENLIAQLRGRTKLYVQVSTAEKAREVLETLELGADGVVLSTNDMATITRTIELVSAGQPLTLEEAHVTVVRDLGMGARVCVDTCDMMRRGMGMLVGTSSQGMMLIQAEVESNPFVSPRPFRVNAGAVSLYTLVPGNKTHYLEEIRAGDDVLIVDGTGSAHTAYVARSKIELRPLVLVEAHSDDRIAKAVLQKAETVKLVTPTGSIAVTDLNEGDTVMARFEEGGRHFGTHVAEETVIEK